MNTLKRLFAAPVFDDELKMQQAYMLNIILWTLIWAPIPYVATTLVFDPENSNRALIQTAFGETVNFILLLMLRRGYVRAAVIIQVSAFWFFFTVTAFTGSGVQGGPYMLGYGLVIAIAGILLGGLGASIFTFLSLASGGWMVYNQMQGRINFNIDPSPLTTWIVSFILFTVGAVLQNVASRNVRIALAHARASEEKYRLISRVSSDYTFAMEVHKDESASLSWVAGAFEQMTGYTYEDYVASGGWVAHVHPDDLDKDAQDMQKLHNNQDSNSEIRTFAKNGEIRWEQIFAHPIWDESENRLVGIFGAVRDITEQKKAGQALSKSESIYRQAIEVAGGVPYHQSYLENGNVVYDFLGEGIRQITGYGPEEFTGMIWDSQAQERLLLEELADYSWDEAIQKVRSGESPIWKCEHRIKARDGKIRWVFEAAVEIRDENGVSHSSVGLFQDITERKQAEEQESRRRAMLEKVVQLGKQVTEVSDLATTLEKIWHGVHDELGFDRVAIFLYDKESHSVNGTLGTNDQGEIADEWDYSQSLYNEKPASFTRALEQPDGVYFTPNYGVEHGIPEGHEMHKVKDFAAVTAWGGDKPVAIIAVDNVLSLRSFTKEQVEALRLFGGYAGLAIENARLNTALEDDLNNRKTLIEELETKNAELERFAYTVSHDLKAPLVTITGFLGYLEQDALAGNAEKIKGGIDRISSAAQKMQALLNDLLELSRIGRLMNSPENIPFEEIVREALGRLRGRLDEFDVLVEIQKNLPVVNVDRVRLVEVIQNLIDNAAKYSDPKSKARIEIGAKADGQDPIVFYVRDNGIGIEPQYHDKIFGLFNKLNVKAEGTGIGLALVKRIIEVHGGQIWVESEIDKGATFYFTIPGDQTKE